MKKMFILIGIIFLLTGCGMEVNINISDTISDDIKLMELSSIVENANDKDINNFVKELSDIEKAYDYYDRSLDIDGDYTFYDYKKEFNYDEYSDLSFMRNCFKNVYITEKDNKITFYAGEEFTCKEAYGLDSFIVNINSDYKVISSNGKKVNDNSYTWEINKVSDDIKIVLDKNKKINKSSSKIPLSLILGLLGIVLLLFIKKKLK